MRFYPILYSMAAIGAGISFTGCSEMALDESLVIEEYTREFIKKFGVPDQDHPWSEAQTMNFSTKSRQCLNVKLMSRCGDMEFVFADLGIVSGKTQFVANVPKDAEHFFVRINDEEDYEITPGRMLDLDAARAGGPNKAVLSRADALTVTYTDRKPSISVLGRVFVNGSTNTYDPLLNEYTPEGDKLTMIRSTADYGDDKGFWLSVHLSCLNNTTTEGGKFKEKSYMNFYPLLARTNRYGESDYVVGLYYRRGDDGEITHMDLCGPGELNATATNLFVEEINGTKTPVPAGEWFMDYGINEKLWYHNGGNFLNLNGISVDVSGFIESTDMVGFYVKSGIRNFNDKIAPNHCKYTHISYSESRYNQPAWELDDQLNRTPCHYDVPVENAPNAYAGSMAAIKSISIRHQNSTGLRDNLSNLTALVKDEYTHANIPLLTTWFFSSQPQGTGIQEADFSDFAMIVETISGLGIGRDMFSSRTPQYLYPWLLAAEDLGAKDDWDFNDLVVSITDVTTNLTAKYTDNRAFYPAPVIMSRILRVKPLAAGATLPDYLMFEGKAGSADIEPTTRFSEVETDFKEGTYIVGTEIHNWLGETDYTKRLNTTDAIVNKGRAVSFSVPLDHTKVDYTKPNATTYTDNHTLAGFWVMVDAANAGQFYETTALETGSDQIEKDLSKALTPFNGRLGDGTYRVNSPGMNGSVVPQMILCHRSWCWPKERIPIADAWPLFSEWVQDQNVIWHSDADHVDLGNYVSKLVIPHTIEDLGVYEYFPE